MPRPTSADVARLAEVSRATVSYVLNNVANQTIPDQTRDAVWRAARELGYRPNPAARALAAGASSVVVFVVPNAHFNELTLTLLSAVSSSLAQRGMTVAVHFETGQDHDLVEIASDLHARAVATTTRLDQHTIAALESLDIRVISTLPNGTTWFDATGTVQVSHLADLGHHRIAFADTDEIGLMDLSASRFAGVVRELERRNLKPPLHAQFSLSGEGASDQLREWVDHGVSAICAFNDEIAMAVLSGMHDLGLTCPADMSVIGVDNLTLSALTTPPLTSVTFDVRAFATEMGQKLAESLVSGESSFEFLGLPGLPWVVSRRSTAALTSA